MLKNKNTNKPSVDIVCLNHIDNVSSETMPIFELFIESLLKCEQEEIIFTIDARKKQVECNIMNLKNNLNLIVKTGKLCAFYEQIKSLLHKPDFSNQNFSGILNVKHNGYKWYFKIQKETGSIDLLRIISNKVVNIKH